MERRAAILRGVVQGLGLRPWLCRLARELGLVGFVRNEPGGVRIEIEGPCTALERFLARLPSCPLPGWSVEAVHWERLPRRHEDAFRIAPSLPEAEPAFPVGPDLATCADCLRELFDPTNRRYRYPFISCACCGPRLTILRDLPYDRERTTMASFPLCASCRAEYEDPADRRFHAQTICCPQCGPRLALRDRQGRMLSVADPLETFAEAIRQGQIGALKGLGGFHLVCSAADERSVQTLRLRKGREAKPLAIMLPDLTSVADYAELDAQERACLASPIAPIVLLRPRKPPAAGRPPIAPSVVRDAPRLGVMLPYTPLHHLLLKATHPLPLVVTSGNRCDEPIVTRDEQALAELAGIADLFLTHDREIAVRCDDAVLQVAAGRPVPVRSSRGLAPLRLPLPLSQDAPTILAVGGQLKGTFALARGREAVLSHHLGDLDTPSALEAMARDIAAYESLFRCRPLYLAHDEHPDYASTHYAQQRCRREGLTPIAVQHHHAHVAACLAEHGQRGPALGIAWDGTGYGPDGAIWGGEFLVADLTGYRRAAHLRYVRLPGGEQAVRQIWRCAAAHLRDAGLPWDLLVRRIEPASLRLIERMIERGVNAPFTSSVGRLFDAVACLLGLRTEVQYEAQAAQELQGLAESVHDDAAYPWELAGADGDETEVWSIDTRPLIRALTGEVQRGVAAEVIARRFHNTLVAMLVEVAGRIAARTGLRAVALSGGVFLNACLLREAERRLDEAGLTVYRHQQVPCNDAGLSWGQLVVAAALATGETGRPYSASAAGVGHAGPGAGKVEP